MKLLVICLALFVGIQLLGVVIIVALDGKTRHFRKENRVRGFHH